MDEIGELHNSLVKHYKTHDTEVKDHLHEYSQDSWETNSDLWDQHREGRKSTSSMYPAIDRHLNKFPAPQDLVVHTGTIHNPEEMKNENSIVHHPAYISGSLDHKVAENFAFHRSTDGNLPNVLKIKVPKGSYHGAYTAEHSINPKEHEFMLKRGLNLKHIKTEKVMNDREKKPYNLHHMEIVDGS